MVTGWQEVLALPIGLALLAYAVREWKARDARIAEANKLLPHNGSNTFRLTVGPVVLGILAALFAYAGLVSVIRYAI